MEEEEEPQDIGETSGAPFLAEVGRGFFFFFGFWVFGTKGLGTKGLGPGLDNIEF